MKKLKAALIVGAAVVAAIAVTNVDDPAERQCKPVRIRCDAPTGLVDNIESAPFGNYSSFDVVLGDCGDKKAYPKSKAHAVQSLLSFAVCDAPAPCDGPECVSWHDELMVRAAEPQCATSVKDGSCVCVTPAVKMMGVPERSTPLDVGVSCAASMSKGDCVPRPCVELSGLPWRH